MKILIMLYNIDSETVGQELVEHLGKIYPEAQGSDSFPICALDGDDSRSQMVLDCLAENGFRPATDLGLRGQNEFTMNLVRVYDNKDLEQCEYLVMEPEPFLRFDITRSPEGFLQIPRSKTKSVKPICHVDYGGILISNRVKKLLEKENMQRVVLRETFTPGQQEHTSTRDDKPYWELTSNLTLPPLSSSMFKVDQSGKVIHGDEEYLLREGLSIPDVLFRPAELHYTVRAIQGVAPFDLALAHEQLGKGDNWWRSLIASQRLYQFCTKNHLKVHWRPVRLEAE